MSRRWNHVATVVPAPLGTLMMSHGNVFLLPENDKKLEMPSFEFGNFVDSSFGLHERVVGDGSLGLEFDEPYVPKPDLGKRYYEYKKKATEKLYPACEGPETTLSALVEVHNVKKQFSWSGTDKEFDKPKDKVYASPSSLRQLKVCEPSLLEDQEVQEVVLEKSTKSMFEPVDQDSQNISPIDDSEDYDQMPSSRKSKSFAIAIFWQVILLMTLLVFGERDYSMFVSSRSSCHQTQSKLTMERLGNTTNHDHMKWPFNHHNHFQARGTSKHSCVFDDIHALDPGWKLDFSGGMAYKSHSVTKFDMLLMEKPHHSENSSLMHGATTLVDGFRINFSPIFDPGTALPSLYSSLDGGKGCPLVIPQELMNHQRACCYIFYSRTPTSRVGIAKDPLKKGVIVYICDSCGVQDIYEPDGSDAIATSEPLGVLMASKVVMLQEQIWGTKGYGLQLMGRTRRLPGYPSVDMGKGMKLVTKCTKISSKFSLI
ncbi:hypothetical protein IFM89_006616 [Coptis chinensis]|uniref:Uncharacterized protein n=1 Tax=Coptis chinensis TaxID=261450 RepID=A0A835IBE4_9MAGN|nr:hypothetical protein IFM89_006616 [Coptis chinensis]